MAATTHRPHKPRYSKADVTFHSDGWDYSDRRPAVNVKCYRQLSDISASEWLGASDGDAAFTLDWVECELSEDDYDYWYQAACTDGWEDLQQDAEYIFDDERVKVYSEGRSDGWAVVDGLPPFDSWDAIMLARWHRFERAAQSTTRYIPESMASLIYLNMFSNPQRQGC